MSKLNEYLKKVDGVSHTTFNPNGPGVVRLHLIPPKKVKLGIPWVVIINGSDIIPLTCGWGILLKTFIDEVNKYQGKPLFEKEIKDITDIVVNKMHVLFPEAETKYFREDLADMVDTFTKIAKGKAVNSEIGYVSLRDYAKYMSAPHRMDLMISSMAKDGKWHCNQQCVHCYAGNQKLAVRNELSTADWKKIIDKLKAARIPQLTFTGGEPTLRSDLVELIDYSRWFITRLNTNGVLLSPELCKKLYDASLDSIQITFYSANEGIHNLLVGAPNFNKTVEGIKNAIAAGLNVSINTPLCNLNKDYVEALKFLKELGITYFTCSGIIESGKAESEEAKDMYLSQEELASIISSATKYCYANALEINFTSPGCLPDNILRKELLAIPSCGACTSNMAISPDGYVIPCQSYLSKELGNILEEDFSKIWKNRETKRIRKEALKKTNNCLLKENNI